MNYPYVIPLFLSGSSIDNPARFSTMATEPLKWSRSLSTLITRDEIAALPLWAQVAFAAQCARCAQPWFNCWCHASDDECRVLDAAITASEHSAASSDDPSFDANDVEAIDRIFRKAIEKARTLLTPDSAIAAFKATHAVIAVAASQKAAKLAAHGDDSGRLGIAEESFTAAESAIAASSYPSSHTRDSAHERTIRDILDDLIRRAHDEAWTDETPIPLDSNSYPGPDAQSDSPKADIT